MSLCQSHEVDNDVIQGKEGTLSSNPSQAGTLFLWVGLDPDFMNLILFLISEMGIIVVATLLDFVAIK